MSDAFVVGRVGVDLYPQQLNTPLEDVRTFEKFVGGFAGNVATGLARLGVATAIVSAVGDDGHGRFVRAWLAAEGVDVSALGTHPTLRTALTFCEAWPPDRFPLTFYRQPSAPDWELRLSEVPVEGIARAALCYVSGTGFAREPSRATQHALLERRSRARGTILDLDWREMLWSDAGEYPLEIERALKHADVVIGGESELEAARVAPDALVARGVRIVVVKRGPEGARVVTSGGAVDVPRIAVPVVNGLGAGDAFAAAFGAALLAGRDERAAAREANAAGAIVAARLSCSAAMPTRAEVDAVLAGATVLDGAVRG